MRTIMELSKKAQQLTDRLNYIKDIFGGKHQEDISLLETRLNEFKTGETENIDEATATIEDLFSFMEKKLEAKLTPMDKVRIVRHPQRICLKDILENVYDNYTEIGGQNEHTNDPAVLIARAYITRRYGKKTYHQSVMVIGHEKGHGEEFRNGGSAKPWGNAKALHYMHVAETEGIPVHSYIFTPGGDPVEEYPGAAQQIAKNIYEMAGLSVPIISLISEGGSGGAEAFGLADKRLMLSHGYYSVISPEGAAAIEGRLKRGERASAELIEQCAKNLHLTAQDNLSFGYIDKIIQEPLLGARPYHYDFFRTLRQEIIRATDEVMLKSSEFSIFNFSKLRRLQNPDVNLDETYVRWHIKRSLRSDLIEERQHKFMRMSRKSYINRQSILGALADTWAEQWREVYNRLVYDIYHRQRKKYVRLREEIEAEWISFKQKTSKPFKNAYNKVRRIDPAAEEELTTLSKWEDENSRNNAWKWVSPKAKEDKAVTCPNSAVHGCIDLWAPDLYNEFAGVCTNCGHHFKMEYQWFMHNCFDENSIHEFNNEWEAGNPLKFPNFDERLKEAREKTKLKSSCITYEARIEGIKCIVAILTAPFRGGSVGAAEGAKLISAIDKARRKRYPLIIYSHGTAGIRIQEGTHGVIQMPRVTIAIRRYMRAGGLYLVLYDTNSFGGPVASFLGCAHYQFAMRSSNLGFAGPAVIKNTTGMDVPPDHHNCYKALSRGHIQGVWDRRDTRTNLKQALLTMGGRNLYYR